MGADEHFVGGNGDTRAEAERVWESDVAKLSTVCADCGSPLLRAQASMGMNLGSGPEYWCDTCRPPADAETVKGTLAAFITPPDLSKSGT
jgi:hypothetical protein